MKTRAAIVIVAGLVVLPAMTRAQELTARAEVGGSARVFPEAPQFGEQASAFVSPSVLFAPEVMLELAGGAWRLVGEGFLRVDAHDDNRSHADIRELGLHFLGDSFSAFGGFGQVFWGVMEVRHLVDIINQVDAVEDLDGEDKLGQPMVTVTLEGAWGALDLYYLPYFRERTFPASDARLRGRLPVEGTAVYAAGSGGWHPGFAARAFRATGAVDVGITAFHGTSREPRFALAYDAERRPVVRAEYDLIDQVGVDAQWTGERTLLKLEAMTRGGHGERFYGVSGGIEHTVYQVLGSDGDLGLLGEIVLDSRGAAAPPTVFDRDVFVGGRWAWNDIADTSVLGGPVIDTRSGEVLVFVEAARRLGSVWKAMVDARLFANADPSSSVYGLRRDGFVSISLIRFF